MKVEAFRAYPATVLQLVAAFALLERAHSTPKATYQGLETVLETDNREALRLVVARAAGHGLVQTVKRGVGRGDKSIFALTAKGREVADLPAAPASAPLRTHSAVKAGL